MGHALNEDFFGGVRDHRIEGLVMGTQSSGSPPSGLAEYCILYKT
jgi:hypothetical protein